MLVFIRRGLGGIGMAMSSSKYMTKAKNIKEKTDSPNYITVEMSTY